MGTALAMVPVAIIIAALLETPSVTSLSFTPEELAAEISEGSNPAPIGKTEVVKPAEGMGSGKMFDRIAFVYDITNKYMSLGLDKYWREVLVQDCLNLSEGDRVLDLATGTADVGILAGLRLQELAGSSKEKLPDSVVGVDPSSEMLRRGVVKVEERGLNGIVNLRYGDAQDLTSVRGVSAEGVLSAPLAGLADDSIDKISMSFGIRNVPNRTLAFREMKRVMRSNPSSRVCILEFSLPTGDKFLSRVAKFFITHVVPFIGNLATGGSGGDEYQYLERSILEFPQPKAFAASMTRQGLEVSTITSFAYGSVHLYTASPTEA